MISAGSADRDDLLCTPSTSLQCCGGTTRRRVTNKERMLGVGRETVSAHTLFIDESFAQSNDEDADGIEGANSRPPQADKLATPLRNPFRLLPGRVSYLWLLNGN
jgi:hypothetical protein